MGDPSVPDSGKGCVLPGCWSLALACRFNAAMGVRKCILKLLDILEEEAQVGRRVWVEPEAVVFLVPGHVC